MAGISIGVWIVASLTIIVISSLTLWVTSKAYSKKWDE